MKAQHRYGSRGTDSCKFNISESNLAFAQRLS